MRHVLDWEVRGVNLAAAKSLLVKNEDWVKNETKVQSDWVKNETTA